MNPGAYIKDRKALIVALLLSLVSCLLLLWVTQLDTSILIIVCVIFVLAFFGGLTWDYLSKRRFYQELSRILENETEAFYASSLVERPAFFEGQLLYDMLDKAGKDMSDHAQKYRLASDEYREYVETWIHEVKTPLAAAHLIIGNKHDSELHSLELELDRLESSVEQALYYARSTAVEKDYALKRVNLDTLVKEAVKKHARILIEQGIVPDFASLDFEVWTDPKCLDFVLGQIIMNAAQYARPLSHTHTPRLLFSAEQKERSFDVSTVVLSVRDNGIGISSYDLPRVFDKGFTGENGRRYGKSTGIGLYLCKKLCNSMKLKLSLDSRQQEGTEVSIEFPLNKMYFLS